MFDFNDIYAELKKGHTAKEIGEAFADELNEAIAEIEDEEEEQALYEDLADAWNQVILHHVKIHAPVEDEQKLREALTFTPERMKNIVIDTLDLVSAGTNLISRIDEKAKQTTTSSSNKKDEAKNAKFKCEKSTFDEIVGDFLNAICD